MKRKGNRKEALRASPSLPEGFRIARILPLLPIPALAFLFGTIGSIATDHRLALIYSAYFLGLTFELKSFEKSWGNVAALIGMSLVGSFALLALVALHDLGKVSGSWLGGAEWWPILFSAIYTLLITLFYRKILTARLDEGITLLHTLTLLYFLVEGVRAGDIGPSWLVLGILPTCLGLIPVAYTLFHSFSYFRITQGDRLFLSIWSTIAMAVFAIDYVKSVWDLADSAPVAAQADVWQGAHLYLEYLLLGAAGAYIVQNLAMITVYYPGKGRFFNEAYFDDVREANALHIERYSSAQMARKEALLILLLVGGGLVANFHFAYLAPSFAVWLCLTFTPKLSRAFGNHPAARSMSPGLEPGPGRKRKNEDYISPKEMVQFMFESIPFPFRSKDRRRTKQRNP